MNNIAREIYLVLDNVKYNNNFGPILRISDALGIKKLFLCRDNRTKLNPKQYEIIKKISRGADEMVDWKLYPDTVEVVKNLKKDGIHIVSLDLSGQKFLNAVDIDIRFPVALVFGSEKNGVNPEILKYSDEVIKIPMYGQGNSLNVSSAVAIVAYKFREWVQ